ncbi:hypothetical protein BDQ17DRAFT_1356916 [Cyathus striatus]|nr:hypothetical protein BDQ17DRAFT_1356916 [Cyathus striatus]
MDSSYSFLPGEVLNEIIQYLPWKTQAILIGVSRGFRSISTQYVYKKSSFNDLPSLLCFCNILSENEGATEAVRSLCFDFKGEPDDKYAFKTNSGLSSTQKRLLRNTLRNISENLLELVILDLPTDLETCIPRYFPNLKSYVSALNVTADTISSLKQNQNIQELRLFGSPVSEHLSKRPVHLPQLQTFIAHPEVVPAFLPDSSPSRPVLLIHPICTRTVFDNAIEVIGNLDASRIVSMGFNCPIAQRWIFPAIPQYLPHVTTLHFAVLPQTIEFRNNLYTGIEQILPLLKDLRMIEIVIRTTENTLSNGNLNEEFEKLKSWSKLSNTLHRVVMPTKTLWAREEDDSDIWIPLSNKSIHTQWLSQKFEYKQMVENLSKPGTKGILPKVVMGPLLHMRSAAGRDFGYVYVPISESDEEDPE